jgi:hypothetical protein
MRTVRDEDGNRYLLLAESAESSRVRDLATGEQRIVANDRLTVVQGTSPLVAAAGSIPDGMRRLLLAVGDDRALGLLVVLGTAGPTSVRRLLADFDLCESDLHGLLGEFRAAGLIEETDVEGERGYALAARGRDALDTLRNAE